MVHSQSFKEKLQKLQPWLPQIIEAVKKDLKNDHLKKDYGFMKRYLPGTNINKVEVDELVKAYGQALQELENGEQIAEFISHRWIFRNSEMYDHFEQKLSVINPDFSSIKELSDAQADALSKEAGKEFGYLRTYVFSLLNGVAFSQAQFEKLADLAKRDHHEKAEKNKQEAELKTLEDMKENHKQELARITDKYEKKLLGLQKKYTSDVESLKKQLANLQRKLA